MSLTSMYYLVMYPITDSPIFVMEVSSREEALDEIEIRFPSLREMHDTAVCVPFVPTGDPIVCLLKDGQRLI